MRKCKVDPTHNVDKYGCIECFINIANQKLWGRMDKEEEKYKNRNPLP